MPYYTTKGLLLLMCVYLLIILSTVFCFIRVFVFVVRKLRPLVLVFVLRKLKPGFHIVVSVVSVVSVVRKKFIGQLQIYGNLPYKCSIQKKRQIQLFVRDTMNSICPMNFFRTTDTTDTTDTTIWKPGLRPGLRASFS